MRPPLLQLNISVVKVVKNMQLWPKGRKTATFFLREVGVVKLVKCETVHLMGGGQNHYIIFFYSPETHRLWRDCSSLYSLK